jgi:hypothetical protein
MKKIILASLLIFAVTAQAQTYIPGYTKRDGTYVEGHYRSAPNQNRYDNYGAQNSLYGGNPYTGKKGSQRDEFSAQPEYNQPRQRQNCQRDAYGYTRCF